MSKAIQSDGIKLLLRNKYSGPGWAFLDEMRLGTGYGANANRYMDGFAVYCFGDCDTIAFEIKVSRSDFQSEMRKPSKRRQALAFSNKFYFVTPKGLLSPDEVPSDSGLIEVHENEQGTGLELVTIVGAPDRERIRPTWRFVAAIARRMACKLE